MSPTMEQTQTLEKYTITRQEVSDLLDLSPSAACRLLVRLEANGLKRKSAGRGTHYVRSEFFRFYEAMDTRP